MNSRHFLQVYVVQLTPPNIFKFVANDVVTDGTENQTTQSMLTFDGSLFLNFILYLSSDLAICFVVFFSLIFI